MIKALTNVRIYDYAKYIESGYIVFDAQIIEVGTMDKFENKGYEVIDGHGQLVLPNFVCNHAHIYSIFARGLILPFHPANFQEILDQMWWKMDRKIDNEITYYSGICAGQEFIKNGVTTIIDHHASGTDISGSLSQLKEALVDVCGIRSILCFETSDRFPVEECIKENISFMDNNHNSLCAGLFGMHASCSLSNDTLFKVSTSVGNRPIHIHVAESKMDEDDSLEKYGKTIVERLWEYGLVNQNSLIVHGVHISDKELELIAKAKAYMVVNTTSNMNNAVGLPDVVNYKKHGIKVLVGNDGLSTSMATEYLNVMYTGRLKNETPNAIGVGEVLEMINDSYEYASKMLGVKLGKIEKGYESDFLTITYTPFTPMDNTNAFGHVFFGLYPNFVPNTVYRGGQCLLKNGKLLNSKIDREMIKANKVSESLWMKLKEE